MSKVEYLIIVAIVGIIIAIAWPAFTLTRQYGRLMDECMADGHKEYECVGILRGQRAR